MLERTKMTISVSSDIAKWVTEQAIKEDRTKGKVIERLIKEYKEKIEEK